MILLDSRGKSRRETGTGWFPWADSEQISRQEAHEGHPRVIAHAREGREGQRMAERATGLWWVLTENSPLELSEDETTLGDASIGVRGPGLQTLPLTSDWMQTILGRAHGLREENALQLRQSLKGADSGGPSCPQQSQPLGEQGLQSCKGTWMEFGSVSQCPPQRGHSYLPQSFLCVVTQQTALNRWILFSVARPFPTEKQMWHY